MSVSRPHLSDPPDPLPVAPVLAASTAPLGGVLLSLLALWIAATPTQLHAVSLNINTGCPGPPLVEPVIHTVGIDFDDTLTWDDQPLASHAALEARLQAVGAMPVEDQPEVYVHPHQRAGYGTFTAVMASAQRHGVQKLGMVGRADEGRDIVIAMPANQFLID